MGPGEASAVLVGYMRVSKRLAWITAISGVVFAGLKVPPHWAHQVPSSQWVSDTAGVPIYRYGRLPPSGSHPQHRRIWSWPRCCAASAWHLIPKPVPSGSVLV